MRVVQIYVSKRQLPFTSTHVMWLCYTKAQPSYNLIYTVDHTVSYRIKNSSVHAHSTKLIGENFKLLKISVDLLRNGTVGHCITNSHNVCQMLC